MGVDEQANVDSLHSDVAEACEECEEVEELALEPEAEPLPLEAEPEVVQEMISECGGEPAVQQPCSRAPPLPRSFLGNHGNHVELRAQRRRERIFLPGLSEPVLNSHRRTTDSRSLSARGESSSQAGRQPALVALRAGSA